MLKQYFLGMMAFALLMVLSTGVQTAFGQHDAATHPSAAASHESTMQDAHGDAHGEHDDGPDKPALLHWDIGSAFWSIVVFVLLLIILRVAAWKPILAALQNREKFITESIAGAKRERMESERLMREYTEKVNKAREEATALVEEGRRDAEALRRKIHEDAKREAAEMVSRAQREIKIAQDNAVASLYQQTVEIATNLAGKIVRKQLNPADHRGLLDESMSEIAKLKN